jgi:D-tyrosyl-tRNA(Tyr) deacylase
MLIINQIILRAQFTFHFISGDQNNSLQQTSATTMYSYIRRTMRCVIQRVTRASVSIDGNLHSQINNGLLVLAGFEDADTSEDINWMSQKIAALRIFGDDAGLMNLSVRDIGGEILVVSQFTLHASTKKGNRPSYIRAAKPPVAIPLYESFLDKMSVELGKPVAAGVFGADMKVELLNDGPVTIVIDSQNKE